MPGSVGFASSRHVETAVTVEEAHHPVDVVGVERVGETVEGRPYVVGYRHCSLVRCSRNRPASIARIALPQNLPRIVASGPSRLPIYADKRQSKATGGGASHRTTETCE